MLSHPGTFFPPYPECGKGHGHKRVYCRVSIHCDIIWEECLAWNGQEFCLFQIQSLQECLGFELPKRIFFFLVFQKRFLFLNVVGHLSELFSAWGIFHVEIKNQKSVLTDMKNKKILNDVCSTGTIFFSQKVGDILLTLLGFLFLGMWFYVIVL